MGIISYQNKNKHEVCVVIHKMKNRSLYQYFYNVIIINITLLYKLDFKLSGPRTSP